MKLIHKNLNRTAIILAVINVSLGVFLAVFDWYWILIWFTYLALFVCIYVMCEARKQSTNRAKTRLREQEEEEQAAQANSDKLNTSVITNASKMSKSNMSLNKLGQSEDAGYEDGRFFIFNILPG
jgi:hypothetical protein